MKVLIIALKILIFTGCGSSIFVDFKPILDNQESSNLTPTTPTPPPPNSVTFLPTNASGDSLSLVYLGFEFSQNLDLNQDGYNDLILTATSGGAGQGEILALSGSDLSELYTYQGDPGEFYFGSTVKAIHDFDNDGVRDIFVSALGVGAGSLTLISGSTGSLIWRREVDEHSFATYGDYHLISDIDSDGTLDIIVSEDNADSSRGMLWALSGADGTTIWTRTGSGGIFPMLKLQLVVDDYNGADGIEDLVVEEDDVIKILSGADGSDLLVCPAINGHSVYEYADINSDGTQDFIVAQQGHNGARGKLQAFSGADCSSLYLVEGENSNDRLKFFNAKINDLNADGFDELIAFSDEINSQEGKVYVISGIDGSILSTAVGSQGTSTFIKGILPIGTDLNNDGIHDYKFEEGHSSSQRRIRFMSGADSSEIFRVTSELPVGGSLRLLNMEADINNDSINDLIFSDSDFDSERGKIYIYSGSDFSLITTKVGKNIGDSFGAQLINTDLDSDGINEFFISAPGYNSGQGVLYRVRDLNEDL